MIKIAIDCMRGDFGPEITVAGVCNALAENDNLHVMLYGNPSMIEPEITAGTDRNRVEIFASEDEITNTDHPLKSIKRKPESALVQALKAVANDEADAFVSAEISGAIFAGSLSIVGKLPGIKRPASVGFMPTMSKTSPHCLMIDTGANIAAKPEHLAQYGRLGTVLARQMMNVENPTIGLLNIGEEDSKGNEFTKETFQLLSEDETINFRGNEEPHTIMQGSHHILLTDGFTGNIMLKSMEGMAAGILNELLENINTDGALSKESLHIIEKSVHAGINRYTNVDAGGGFVLGVQKPVVITHGAAGSTMFKNSIQLAVSLKESDAFASLNE